MQGSAPQRVSANLFADSSIGGVTINVCVDVMSSFHVWRIPRPRAKTDGTHSVALDLSATHTFSLIVDQFCDR